MIIFYNRLISINNASNLSQPQRDQPADHQADDLKNIDIIDWRLNQRMTTISY